MNLKVIKKSKHELPKYATPSSAGMDLRANIDAPVTIKSGERVLIPTGIHIQLPKGYEAQVRPRSGLFLKHGVSAHLGTIDSDYRGDIGVMLINHGKDDFTVNDGDRIAQLVISKFEKVEWEPVLFLDDSERGEGGFGHTGNK
jgi:dUTP pyrophosphatase